MRKLTQQSSTEDPTPCPPPRFPNRSASSKLAPLLEEPNAASLSHLHHHQPILCGAKPKRPTRKARKSAAWDPTLDIYDDTFAFKGRDVPSTQPTCDEQALEQPAYSQSLNRRNSLWAQPAQRLPLDADVKRRRVSTAQAPEQTCNVQTQPVIHSSVDTSAPINHSYLKKDPRRRTIWVPSDDTTVMTIHPGASLRDQNQKLQKPRRSDLFLDLATCLDSDLKQADETKQIKKPPRKSLSVAPRKAPLQPATRGFQPNSNLRDVLGSGGGKENVPPGTLDINNEMKPDEDNTCFLKASARRVSTSSYKSTVASHKAPSLYLTGHHEPLRSKDVNSPKRKTTEKSSGSESGSFPMYATGHQASPSSSKHPFLQKRTSLGPFVRAETFDDKSFSSKPRVPVIAQQNRRATCVYPALTAGVPCSEMYEENWLSHQECAITALINDLFEKTGRHKHTVVHDNLELQRKLVEMYHDPAILLLHKRIKASLQFGALSISKDALGQVGRLKDDLKQRQRFLDLWVKTYNLKSLQSVAEAVIGRQVSQNFRLSSSPPRAQSSEMVPPRDRHLEAFLKSFLIRNEDFVPKKGISLNSIREDDWETDHGSTASVWRRTVVRSLMIILLLDKAHKAGLFKECLFQPSSPFKSSTAVIVAFGSLLLPSIGNVNRVLEHLAYQVEQVQHPLEEQKYHIDNLAVDLRDGVLLTRLVEILLYTPSTLESEHENITLTLPCGDELTSSFTSDTPGRNWPLSQHLKYPCHSRVQKLYNVHIALSALSSVEDFQAILENIKPEDIVDGHREKNVSLLWSIVGKWGLSALLDLRMLQQENKRLDKRWQELNGLEATTCLANQDNEYGTTLSYETGSTPSALMLKEWARKAARLHGVTVTNSSTSFFGGEAYRAIAAEYLPHVSEGLRKNLDSSPSRKSSVHPSTSISTVRSNSLSKSCSDMALVDILTRLGCARAFISLFRNTSAMPSELTTLPLLAFLASRFLPASQPYFAATTIQQAWRKCQMRWNLRRRVKLAVLARDCATVVVAQERINKAAIVLQRWWRRVGAS